MAYTHGQYGVFMVGNAYPSNTASGAVSAALQIAATGSFGNPLVNAAPLRVTYNPTGYGSHYWDPGCMPHRIVRVGVKSQFNLAGAAQNLIFTVHNGVSNTASGPAFTFMLPTNTATGLSTVKTVTNYVVVNPGQTLRAAVSTADEACVARIALWVEPVWEEIANVTDAQAPTA